MSSNLILDFVSSYSKLKLNILILLSKSMKIYRACFIKARIETTLLSGSNLRLFEPHPSLPPHATRLMGDIANMMAVSKQMMMYVFSHQ